MFEIMDMQIKETIVAVLVCIENSRSLSGIARQATWCRTVTLLTIHTELLLNVLILFIER